MNLPTEGNPKILVVIPAYNEAERLGAVAAAAASHLPVLVVDDGSRDETARVGREAGAEVLEQKPNQGKGAALRAGFRYALAQGCDAVITLDADGQHDPTEIPLFLQALQETGADLIIGRRDFSRMPWVRRLSNTLGTRLFSWAAGQAVHDNQSGYRLISRRLMEASLRSAQQGFAFEVEMIVECVRSGFQLAWVPIRTIYAGEGSHISPLKHVVEFVRVSAQTRRSLRRGK
ncbi:MAG TPA: glycosyltransferase family 2 protein [Anaerolineaceae bacterium]|nr:glycosyltransferase family 2 protein [Anaerolineaceae bacterium]